MKKSTTSLLAARRLGKIIPVQTKPVFVRPLNRSYRKESSSSKYIYFSLFSSILKEPLFWMSGPFWYKIIFILSLSVIFGLPVSLQKYTEHYLSIYQNFLLFMLTIGINYLCLYSFLFYCRKWMIKKQK